MLADFLPIQKATFGSVAFLSDDHLYPDQSGLVGQHVDEASIRNVSNTKIRRTIRINH